MRLPLKQPNRINARTVTHLTALIGALALWCTSSLLAKGSQSETTPPAGPPVDEPITRALRRPVLGVALNMHHVSDLDAYLRSVDQIAELGANALVVVTPWFQETTTTNTIEYLPDRCPTDEQLRAVLQRAKDRKLRTALVPIVLITHPIGKQWRGTLAPSDWQKWWQSYATFVKHFAHLADQTDVDILSLGSELNSTEDQQQHWAALTAATRRTFSGALTYTANWDRYDKVEFWHLFDVISISAYFELVEEPAQASKVKMIDTWSTLAKKLTTFAATQGLPLLLMEVGYPSLPWAAVRPWDYRPKETQTADHTAQVQAYEAFLRIWTTALTSSSCPIRGFFLYHWDPYHSGGHLDFGYGIGGKPTESLVRDAFAQIKEQAQQAPEAPESVAN